MLKIFLKVSKSLKFEYIEMLKKKRYPLIPFSLNI